jgi:predicted metal-dependent hydrolase
VGYSETIEIAGVGLVLFERSRKARHLNLSVRPYAGVRVAVPRGLSFQRALEFVHTKTGWIQKHVARMREYEQKAETARLGSGNVDRPQATREIVRRLGDLAERHGFAYGRVFIRNQKTRWGSCSRENNISLNINISRLPPELTDYVILHELAHTRVKNHGNRFWALLDKLVGDGRAQAASLRAHAVGYLERCG